jgi:hypothetical protein
VRVPVVVPVTVGVKTRVTVHVENPAIVAPQLVEVIA